MVPEREQRSENSDTTHVLAFIDVGVALEISPGLKTFLLLALIDRCPIAGTNGVRLSVLVPLLGGYEGLHVGPKISINRRIESTA